MAPELSTSRLRSTIEHLVEEADPRLRDRLLVAGARLAVGATAAALWRESSPGAWWCVCAAGSEPDQPSRVQVEAEDAEELVEPLLLLHDSLERDGSSVADRVLPPFAAEDFAISAKSSRGIHRPERGPADGELRALLSGIRESQERLAREALDAEERAREGEILDQRCQRAGDLLLGPESQTPPGGDPA
jgi:hypothetical protein